MAYLALCKKEIASLMSLKTINESYRALSVQALWSTVVKHIKKYIRQMVATVLAEGCRHFVTVLLSGVAALDCSTTIYEKCISGNAT